MKGRRHDLHHRNSATADRFGGGVLYGNGVWEMTLPLKIFWFVLRWLTPFAIGCAVGSQCFAQARVPAYAATIAMQARAELAKHDPHAAEFTQFIWSPTASDDEYAAVAVALNTALNQSAVEVTPRRLFGGALIAVDLTQLADDADELAFVTHEWFRHAEDEPYFHVQVIVDGKPKTHDVICPKFLHTDGKWYTSRTAKVVIAAPHLGVNMPVGLVYRADEFVSRVLSSVGRGTYLRWRRITPGVTKLADYLKSRNASTPQSIERAIVDSDVTGGPRGIRFWNTQSTVPSQGAGVFWITDDISKDNRNDAANVSRNIRKAKVDAHEGILTLENGWPEYTLWNGAEVAQKNAPEDVAKNKGRHPWDERIHGAISCIQCHGPNEGLQPFRNIGRDMLVQQGIDFKGLFGGFRPGANHEELRAILSEFRAEQFEIDALLQNSRDSLSNRTFAVTRLLGELNRMNARPAFEAVTAVYGEYEERWVTPAIAAQELGFAVPVDDPTGARTMQFAVPRLNLPQGVYVNDPAAEFWIDEPDLRTGARISGKMTRREWERLYPEFASRSKESLAIAERRALEDSRQLMREGFNIDKEQIQ